MTAARLFLQAQALLCFLAPIHLPAVADPGSSEFFESKIRPLLVEHCQECHSSDGKRKGGLALDHRQGLLSGGDSGPALAPGDSAASLLLRAVSYQDRDLKMPPDGKLSPAQIDALTEWIAAGAHDPRDKPAAAGDGGSAADASSLWSFQPLQSPSPDTRLPAVSDPTWPRDPVDHHILAALDGAGLRPVNDAAPETLLRRLHFDLTGLPPGPETVQAFMADQSALPQIIDDLIASPAFAERWTQHWLDITRFAESSGGGRTLPFKDAWRFRDYVIESIHADIPLDRVITEHIAGDLLPAEDAAASRRQLAATAFLALGPTNYEEQDKGLLRMDIIDEQLETIGRSFMGMTIGCARCHDHKFDPVSIRDYYALAGIFRSTQTLKNYTDNVARWIDRPLPLDPELEATVAVREKKLAALKQELKQTTDLVKSLEGDSPSPLAVKKPIPPSELPGIVIDDAQAEVVGPWVDSTSFSTYIGAGYIHDAKDNKGQCTATFIPAIPATGRYEVRVSYTSSPSRDKQVPVHILHADGEEDIHIDQSVPPPIHGRFVSLGSFRFEKNGAGFIMVSNEGTTGHVTLDAVWLLDEATLAAESQSRAPGDDPRLAAALAEKSRLERAIRDTEKSGPSRPETMSVLEDPEPADCPVHIRGNIRNLGPPVPRGFIQAALFPGAPEIPADQSGRLQLAQWVTHPDHPLTARVLVNRVWMHLFGEGLVRSVDNFGATGDQPTHPLLLDHLAADFISSGWSLKKLVRRLVLTRAYQLASIPSPDSNWQRCDEADPDNKLLWRANRRRLDAHALRDSMLSVAGTLDPAFLGPNVEAYAVDSNSAAAQNLEYDFVFTDTRRSVYTPAFRNRRLEIFEAFDYADINSPVGQRTRGTIAPQALYFLNHPFVIEQSAAAARRVLADQALAGNDEARVRHLWLAVLARQPSPTELRQAIDFITVSPSDDPGRALENHSLLVQTLFATADFRFLD